MTKVQLRQRLLRQLRQQKEDVRHRESAAIWRKVCRLRAFRQAQTVCCYVSLPYEVQTWQLIEAMLKRGKRIVVPRTRRGSRQLGLSELRDPRTELTPGAFGVWEPTSEAVRPVPVEEVDLVLVPGLAFDRAGHRLGHGHGYFDRFLARVPRTTPTVGLAYRLQVLDRLPTTAYDQPVQAVLTA